MINKFICKVIETMEKLDKRGFFRKLMDKNEPEVAASNFFVVCVLAIGLILLAVPVFILVIEAIFNHTIATDLNGMAAYIMAVAAIFTSAGITKIGVHYSDTRNVPRENLHKEITEENFEEKCEEIDEMNYGRKLSD